MEGFLLLAVAGLAFHGYLQHRQIKMLWEYARAIGNHQDTWLRNHQERLADLECKGDGYNPAFEMKAFNRDF